VPTASAARAAAAAINLTSADLSAAFTSKAHKDSSKDDAMGKELATCMGASDPKNGSVVDLNSRDFERGSPLQHEEVTSSVSVVKAAKQARSDLTALTGYKAIGCLEVFMNKVLQAQAGKTPNVSFSPSTATKIDVSTPGADGGFGYALSVDLSAGTMTFPLEIDLLGVLKGHTEVTLTVTGIGHPFPSAQREALFAKLVGRTVASAV